MATLQDVQDQHDRMHIMVKLFGASREWLQNANDVLRRAGEVFMEERGISKEKAMQLPMNTILGPKAEAAYREFKSLLDTTS